ncbi:DDE-type integrase/transposase/recombinase [Streptomyces mirabilis]|uniref:DDE-type integrase/transposase/recombinase n=1 Tax=Streptomyces mirabilis TaxID=68239 RepID=UPI00343A6C2B
MDLVGGIFLADGRECQMLTGIDDHSRFVVTATVLAVPSGQAVADGFVRAMRTYGVPAEVLTDNGKQLTGLHQAQARRGAVRTCLPGERRHRQTDQTVLPDHNGQDREVAPDPAP